MDLKIDASFIDEFLSDNLIDTNDFDSLLNDQADSSSDDGFSGSSGFSPESSPPQKVYQSPSGSSGTSDLKISSDLDDLLSLPNDYSIDEIITNYQPTNQRPVIPPPIRKVVRSAPYEVRKIEKPVKIIGHPNSQVKRIKPPVREQKIHSTPKCQIIKVEPQDHKVVQKPTVVVKVEPQQVIQQSYPSKTVFARPNDIVSQAWNSSVVSSGMDDRGRIIKRTQAQMKAEERKIRNRQSASQSRERKKQMAERMEIENKRLKIENENQKTRIMELENRVKYLEAENKRIVRQFQQNQSKNVSVTAGALFSLAIVGYFMTPISTQPSSTEMSISNIHHPSGRSLMGYHHEEEKALAYPEKSKPELSATDYWLDDTLQKLRNNADLATITKLASEGPVTIQRIIRRKLYEEFGIKIGRVPDIRRNRGLPSSASRHRLKMPPVQPRMRHYNPMCDNTVKNGDKLHKVLESWKMPKVENQNETGLIKRTQWSEHDLLRSLSATFKNDSYYLVSLSPLQFIMPPSLNNTDSGPKMTVVMPTGDTNLSNEHLDMIQIDCVVTGTKSIALSRPMDHVEQDDDEVRVEIEV